MIHFFLTVAMICQEARTAPIPADTGRTLFEHNCSRCHGADGTKGFLGAKNLRRSLLPDSAIVERIQNGKRIMPSFRKKLRPEEIQTLATYVKTLRTN